MRQARRKRGKVDLLALATMMTSPECGAWMCGLGPAPRHDTPQSVVRLLDLHIGQLATATASLVQAKTAVHGRDWKEAKRLIGLSFDEFTPFASYRDDFIRLLRTAASHRI